MKQTDWSPPTETDMPLAKELLEILVCPVCKTPVEELGDDSGLKCGSCNRVYPILDEIPVMLPEEAKITKESFVEDLKI
jgi:uncharacterized protein YbaR (Trm112 family)